MKLLLNLLGKTGAKLCGQTCHCNLTIILLSPSQPLDVLGSTDQAALSLVSEWLLKIIHPQPQGIKCMPDSKWGRGHTIPPCLPGLVGTNSKSLALTGRESVSSTPLLLFSKCTSLCLQHTHWPPSMPSLHPHASVLSPKPSPEMVWPNLQLNRLHPPLHDPSSNHPWRQVLLAPADTTHRHVGLFPKHVRTDM